MTGAEVMALILVIAGAGLIRAELADGWLFLGLGFMTIAIVIVAVELVIS